MKASLPADIVIKDKEQRSRSKLSDAGSVYMTVFRRLTENLIRLAGAKDDVSRRHEDKKGKCNMKVYSKQ